MEDAKSIFLKAKDLEKRGKAQEALKIYRALAKKNPDFRPVFAALGEFYSRYGRPDLSIGFFTRARELKEDEIVDFNLGSENYKLGNYRASKQMLIEALKKNPRLLKGHILLAYVYVKESAPQKAWIYFENALKIEPGNRAALLGYVTSLIDSDRNEQALSILEKYRQSIEKDHALRDLRAALMLKLGKLNESMNDYIELSQKSEKFTNFTDHLKKAKEESNREKSVLFEGIDDKIKERTRKAKLRLEERKKQRAGSTDSRQALPAEKEELRDMVDLSLLHLFNGDPEKAMKFLFQAKKMHGK